MTSTATGYKATTRRYDITCDRTMTHADVTILTQGGDGQRMTPILRKPVRGDQKPAMIAAIADIITEDYFASRPNRLDRPQHAALTRLIARRLVPGAAATLTSDEIATALLKAIVSPPADFWAERHSVPRSSGDGTWTVSRARDGTWGCSCPRWRFKREHCKHIDEVQSHPHWYPFTP